METNVSSGFLITLLLNSIMLTIAVIVLIILAMVIVLNRKICRSGFYSVLVLQALSLSYISLLSFAFLHYLEVMVQGHKKSIKDETRNRKENGHG